MVKLTVILGLVVQGSKCRGVWWHWVQVWGGMISLWPRPLGSTALTTV